MTTEISEDTLRHQAADEDPTNHPNEEQNPKKSHRPPFEPELEVDPKNDKNLQKIYSKGRRMSEAFPPNREKSKKQLKAKIHSLLSSPNFVFEKSKIEFRYNQMTNDLLKQLRVLNYEWFPVEYGQEFYSEISRGFLNTYLALYPIGGKMYIIGGLVFKTVEIDQKYISYYDGFCNFFGWWKSAHIYTIGVVNGLRGTGIGSMLMTNFLNFLEAKEGADERFYSYGVVELEVVAYNKRAIGYYVRNGFEHFCTKKYHYEIYGERFDAIGMVFYLNGFKRKRTFF